VSLGGPLPLPLPLDANPPLVFGPLFRLGWGFSTLLIFRGFWGWGLHAVSLLPCRASFRSATLMRWSSSDNMYSSSSWKSSSSVLDFFHVRCEVVGPVVRPLISALIVVLSSASGICGLCCMNLLTKFCNGSLSFCLQLYKSDDSTVVSWNIWNACINFVLRSTQL
jgi:hypothetical protein